MSSQRGRSVVQNTRPTKPNGRCRSSVHLRSFFKRLGEDRFKVWREWRYDPPCPACRSATPPPPTPARTQQLPLPQTQTQADSSVKKIKYRLPNKSFMLRRGSASALRACPSPPRCPEGSRLFLNRNMRKVCKRGHRPRLAPRARPAGGGGGGAAVEAVSRRLRTADTATDTPPLVFYVEYLLRPWLTNYYTILTRQ